MPAFYLPGVKFTLTSGEIKKLRREFADIPHTLPGRYFTVVIDVGEGSTTPAGYFNLHASLIREDRRGASLDEVGAAAKAPPPPPPPPQRRRKRGPPPPPPPRR